MSRSNEIGKTVEPITEELFREAYQFEEVQSPSFKKAITSGLKCSKADILSFFPIAKWAPKYSVKKDLVGDIIAGLTVAVMHIPHGLAYAQLGRVEPVVGFYMAIFPVFIYIFLGTSRHISLGTFAVLCAMVGQVVLKHEISSTNGSSNATLLESENGKYKNIEVGATVCLMVGIWQAALGLLRLGSLTVILSESLISGFTTGAAVHVFTYQLKNLFGVKIFAFSGILKLLYIYEDFFSKIKTVNWVTMCISAVSIIILLIFNELVKPLTQKKFPKNKVPIPIELIVIILGVLVSYFLDLEKEYDVKIVGNIPTGFPEPLAPPVGLLPHVVVDSLVIAAVALAINLSLAKIFAKKCDYEVSSNQEFIAYGAANIFACFFQCLPSAASLSRSTIQYSVGGKSQLASLFSITLIIFILLVAGSLFEPVPYCVLSSIVVVTLKSLLMQVKDFWGISKKSPWDGMVWMGTFLAVVILDLDIGLGVGILLSLITILFSTNRLQINILGRVPNTNIYLDINHYKTAEPVPKVFIIQIIGNLNFANKTNFETDILDKCKNYADSSLVKEKFYLVLNMSSVTEIDPSSVNSLKHVYKSLQKIDCEMYLTDCNLKVYKMFEICNLYKDLPKDHILASVADAVEYLTSIS